MEQGKKGADPPWFLAEAIEWTKHKTNEGQMFGISGSGEGDE